MTVGPVGQDDAVLHVDLAHVVADVAIKDADDLLPFVVAKALDEGRIQGLDVLHGARVADHVEGFHFEGRQGGGVLRSVDRGVRAAGQRGRGCGRQGDDGAEGDEVIRDQGSGARPDFATVWLSMTISSR